MNITVAIAQIDIVLGDAEANLRTVQAAAAQAAEHHADLLVLPELWGSGYMLERAGELADEINTGLFAATAALARHHRITICGSLLEWDAGTGQAYNTATLYDDGGYLRGSYRKVHLIGLMNEGQYLQPGEQLGAFEMPWGKGALAICYDLRFPELFRRYALDGAGVILLPSEWPTPRIEHWRTLIKARAIENQCFVLASNRVGSDRSNTFGGRSAVVDPWGNVLAEGNDTTPDLLVATLDLDVIEQARSFLPVFADRRPDVYRLDEQVND